MRKPFNGLFALLVWATACRAQVPLPEDVNIVVPGVGLRKDLAAFSGKWSGVWSGSIESLLIVEEIDAERAKVIYAWGDAPNWKLEKGFRRYSATVMPGDNAELRFTGSSLVGSSVETTVKMNKDLSSVTVTRINAMPRQRVDVETFKRVAQ